MQESSWNKVCLDGKDAGISLNRIEIFDSA